MSRGLERAAANGLIICSSVEREWAGVLGGVLQLCMCEILYVRGRRSAGGERKRKRDRRRKEGRKEEMKEEMKEGKKERKK